MTPSPLYLLLFLLLIAVFLLVLNLFIKRPGIAKALSFYALFGVLIWVTVAGVQVYS